MQAEQWVNKMTKAAENEQPEVESAGQPYRSVYVYNHLCCLLWLLVLMGNCKLFTTTLHIFL